MCSVMAASRTRARKNSSTSSVSNVPTFCAGRGRVKAEAGPAAEVHSHKCQRLVHGQGGAGRNAARPLIAQGGAQRLPQRDADVLHGMVVVHLRIAHAAHAQVKAGMGGKGGVSMWSRKPQPVRMSLCPVPSRFRVREMSVSAVLRWMVALLMISSFPNRMARVSQHEAARLLRVPMEMRTCSPKRRVIQQRMSTPR